MEHDNTPKEPTAFAEGGAYASATEEELSRIACEAVRQPPDRRLDKQLARMGLGETSQPAEPQPGQPTGRSVEIAPEPERLGKELWRIEVLLWVVVAVIGILAVMVVVLLFR
ncbi:MAG: hypothetical protein M3P43_18145 [Actinomycetota bacterium]|nr:hypothetical protein [Actinomycetota bacterium]